MARMDRDSLPRHSAGKGLYRDLTARAPRPPPGSSQPGKQNGPQMPAAIDHEGSSSAGYAGQPEGISLNIGVLTNLS
jgi:hypothetical protein